LIEPLENSIGCRRIIQVETLRERDRLQEFCSLRSDVAHFDQKIFTQLILRSDVPLLNIGSAQVSINGAKLKRLGDVAPDGQPRRRINRIERAVCPARDVGVISKRVYYVCAAAANNAIGQILVKRE
jgi:hypothetical protein